MIDLLPPPVDVANQAWNRMDDAALWGRLAELTADRPDWPDSEIRSLIKGWADARRTDPWLDDVHRFWDRWKQHQADLAQGLAAAGPMRWSEICSFCQVWTAHRPIMSPFSGVAGVVLDHVDRLPPQPTLLPPVPPVQTERSGGWRSRREIVVVSASGTRHDLAEYEASRQLIWALDETGVPWSLRQPWDRTAPLDPATTHAVIFWSYRHLDRDYVHHAMRVERHCVAHGIPVINSIANGWDMRHSTSLEHFQRAGIPCPRFQHFVDVDDIELEYPLVLRVDGLHRGRRMHLVFSPDEARRVVDGARSEFLRPSRRTAPRPAGSAAPARSTGRALPPPNLAVQFVDTAGASGRSTKRRALVVGGRVIPRHQLTSRHWLVNFGSLERTDESIEAHRRFVQDGDEDAALVARAGRATGSDVTALDYTRTADGRYVFWEANRIFVMSGDPDYDVADPAPARSAIRSLSNHRLGKALLSLLQGRVRAHETV